MTRYDAYIEKGWEEVGRGFLVIVRVEADGSSDLAGFELDLLCLGVREAFLESALSADEVRDYLAEQLPDDTRERLHPACAKKLIAGAAAYAEGLGFAPHRDYRKARRILSGIDAGACPREFTFGHEGRPCYVRADDDDEDRVARICGILEAKLGPGGFFYEDPQAEEEEVLARRDELIAFLAAEEEDVPRFYEVNGLIMAMLLAPVATAPHELLPLLWPEGAREWRNEEEVRQFLDLLQAYWNEMNDRAEAAVHAEARPDYPIVDVTEGEFDDDQTSGLALAAATMDWARGFLRATDTWPAAWAGARRRPDLAPYWEVIGWWANFDEAANREAIMRHATTEPRRTLNQSVLALARALRPPTPPSGK